jgi:cell division protein ZipA
MDGLRWLLLFFGVLVIGGVYLYSRRPAKPKVDESDAARREPTLETSLSPESGETEEAEFKPIDADSEFDESEELDTLDNLSLAPTKIAEEKIVTLRIVARNGGTFAGDELILSLRGIGMRHGQFGIFHRYDGNNEKNPVFSAASLVEPGSFDLANIKGQEIPGISLFLVLPGPIDGVEAFDMLMAAARTLAQSLDGELLDESGSTLSIQRERYMREEIVQYQHSIKVA